jgi:hypothetical protein
MMRRAIVGWAIGFSALVLRGTPAAGGVYYVAIGGADTNSGSIAHPWATLKHALSSSGNGDTLYLRKGVYLENGLAMSGKSGVLISGYPGEKAEISGGISNFREPSDTTWELYDAATRLYRSRDIIFGTAYLGAWLLDDSIQLVRYDNLANLQSTNYGPVHGFDPVYQGPGILYGSDLRLYIRLQNNPNDLVNPLGRPIVPVPADLDPGHHATSISFASTLFSVSSSSAVRFRSLTFSHARYLFDITSATSNLEFDGCTFIYGSYAFVLRGTSSAPAARDMEIHDCEFSNGLPGYVYWCDVKNKDHEVGEAYPEFQSEAISGPAPGFSIHNNRFHDSFDAMDLKEGTENTRIFDNQFFRLRDDAITLCIVKDVEIDHNLMWGVGEGISCDFDTTDKTTDGNVYIHHNVIDASHYQHGGREGNYRASNWPVWQIIDAFGSHGDAYPAKWKVYNNTTVHRRSGYSYDPAELPAKVQSSADLSVLNNIFLILDDRIAFRGRLASSGAHYDGNVMYRLLDSTYHQPQVNTFPLYYQFGNGGNFQSLADFKSLSGTSWELSGIEANPGFDLLSIIDGEYDGDDTWTRYIPGNGLVGTTGASYDGLGWPGTEGIDYRGALVNPALAVALHDPATANIPRLFSLDQNFPNPYNPATTIRFSVPVAGRYSMTLFNMIGQQVALAFDGQFAAGYHVVSFSAAGLATGAYVYVLSGNSERIAKTMIVLR